MTLVYRDAADLDKFPSVRTRKVKDIEDAKDMEEAKAIANSKHISLGDLHGNALKLIYTLVEEGVIELSEGDYNVLRDIYNTPVRLLTAAQLSTFKDLITKAEVNKDKAITLIGDELADRGQNDYFTLLVLNKLHDSNVNFDILLSNHSAEFIRDYDEPEFTGRCALAPGQGQSLANMRYLIANGLIQENEVRGLVKTSYIPRVKAISYTLSPDGELTIFTHAPVGLETIQSLAQKFGIPYEDKTTKALVDTIEKINAEVKNKFMERNLGKLIDDEQSHPPKLPIPPKEAPLQRLIWNRVVGDELVTETSTGIKVKFVHGHTGDGPMFKDGKELTSHQNIDSSWAKLPIFYQTGTKNNIQHFTRHTNDLTALELTPDCWKAIQLAAPQKYFATLCAELSLVTNPFIKKGTKENPEFDANYLELGRAAQKLHDALESSQKLFFSQAVTRQSVAQFALAIEEAVKEAHDEFSQHQNIWNNGDNPLVSFIKGFLKILDTLLFLLPNAITGKNYSFFDERKELVQLKSFKKDFQVLIDKIELDEPQQDADSTALP